MQIENDCHFKGYNSNCSCATAQISPWIKNWSGVATDAHSRMAWQDDHFTEHEVDRVTLQYQVSKAAFLRFFALLRPTDLLIRMHCDAVKQP